MKSGKRFGVGLLSTLFVFCILNLAVFTAVNVVFSKPATLKKALVTSKIYDSAATSIAEQTAKAGKEQAEQVLPGQGAAQANPLIQAAAREVITPQKLQTYTEQVVDGTYHWLDGTTKTPDFRLDLSSDKQALANAVGNAGVQRLRTLPVCTPAQLQQFDPATVDPFNMPCHPVGFDNEAQRQKLVNDISGSQDVLKDTTVTSQTLVNKETGKDPFQQLKVLPKLFQWSQFLPAVLGVLGILAGVGIVFLSATRREGLKRVAKASLISGALLLITIVIVNLIFSKVSLNAASESAAVQASALSLVKSLNASLNRILLIFALVYAIGGTGGLLGLHFTKKPTTTRQRL